MSESVVRVIIEGASGVDPGTGKQTPADGSKAGKGAARSDWAGGLRDAGRPGQVNGDQPAVNGSRPVRVPTTGKWAAGLENAGKANPNSSNGNGNGAANGSPRGDLNGTGRRRGVAGSFDPTLEALKILDREARKRETSREYQRLSPDGVPLGVRVRDYIPGMPPPRVQVKPPKVGGEGEGSSEETSGKSLGRLGRAIGLVTTALTTLGQVLSMITETARTDIRATAMAVGSNDIVGERMARRQQSISNIKTGTTIGGTLVGAGIGAAIGTAIFPGLGTVGGALVGAAIGAGTGGAAGYGVGKIATYGKEKDQTEDMRLVQSGAALQERLNRLGQYGGQIRGALARQRLDEFRRNITEANALGPEGSRLIGIQTENERLRQTIGSIKSLKDAGEQQNRLAKENEALRKEIAELSRTVKGAAALADKLARGGKTPLDKILEGIAIPEDDWRGEQRRRIKQLRDEKLNQPAFGGLP